MRHRERRTAVARVDIGVRGCLAKVEVKSSTPSVVTIWTSALNWRMSQVPPKANGFEKVFNGSKLNDKHTDRNQIRRLSTTK